MMRQKIVLLYLVIRLPQGSLWGDPGFLQSRQVVCSEFRESLKSSSQCNNNWLKENRVFSLPHPIKHFSGSLKPIILHLMMSVDLDFAPIDNTDDHTEKPDAPKKRLCQGVIPETIWLHLDSHTYTNVYYHSKNHINTILRRQWLNIATAVTLI